MTRHQYGILRSFLRRQFQGETSGSVAKYRLFSQVTDLSWENVSTQQRDNVFIFLRNSPRSAITKAFTLDYFHKICIRVISRMRQHKWRKKCNDCFRNCVSGVLNFYDVLCIYFFIPRFKFSKFIYSSFHAWSKYKISAIHVGVKEVAVCYSTCRENRGFAMFLSFSG